MSEGWVKLWCLIAIALYCGSCVQKDKSYPLVEVPVADAGFYQTSLAEVDALVKSDPGNPDAHFKKAIYLQALGNTEEALTAVKQAIKLDAAPDYLMKEAELLTLTGDYSTALARVSRAQILGANYPDLWHLMARLNYLEGNYNNALTEVTLAINKYPKGLAYYSTKGKIEWALHDTTAALNSFYKSAGHPETEYESLRFLAMIHQSMGDYQVAFELLERNLGKYHNDYKLLLEKGKLFALTAQFDSAISIYHQLMMVDTTDIEPLYGSAVVYFNRRWYDSTIYYTDRILQIDSTHLPSLLTQARVYDRRTYYGSSIRKYQQILAIDSTYQPAVDELAKLKGKIAYLQKIRQDREANSQVEVILPTKPPVRD